MKLNRYLKAALLAVVGGALAWSAPKTSAQTIITNGFTFDFPNNGETNPYVSTGSATWFYWYDFGGDVTNDPSMDASNNPSSGSMKVGFPFTTAGHNALFVGTFAENPANNYDFSVEANLLVYSNISFDVHVAPGTPTDANGDYGFLGVGIINSGYGYQNMGSVTIPGAATNGWAHMSVNIDKTQANLTGVPGIVLDKNNYSGYPQVPFTFWVDNVTANAPPAPLPPPPTLSRPSVPITGLNCIASVAGANGQYNREQLSTVTDSGYSFVDQPNVTYSWNITSFPTNSAFGFQQHFFIVNGQPGQYDQAADYNLADCIFITVQATGATNGSGGLMNFRYKTNEPGGNGMLFNTAAPTVSNSLPTYTTNADLSVTTNAPANSNFWPVMPVCNLNSTSVVGTWSVSFNNMTNVTLTGPGGVSTNFVLDPASAQLFADPATVLLGAQPNNTDNAGEGVVYSSFSITGNDTPFTDNFATDTSLNTNIWTKAESSDTNGVVLVPASSALWLYWTLPDQSFSLQGNSNAVGTNWTDLSKVPLLKIGSDRAALVDTSELPSPNQSYFSLVKRAYTQLQVLLPGETNAPGTATGKIGTPTEVFGGSTGTSQPEAITVLAVDPNFFPVTGVTDNVSISSDDGEALLPLAANLVNGVGSYTIYFGQEGTFHVTATDTVNTNTATSSPVLVGP